MFFAIGPGSIFGNMAFGEPNTGLWSMALRNAVHLGMANNMVVSWCRCSLVSGKQIKNVRRARNRNQSYFWGL